jgi:hypothetical protein
MELIFNELSFLPYIDNDIVLKEHFINMLSVFEKTKTDFKYRHIIFPSNIGELKATIDKNFNQWLYTSNRSVINTISSVIKRPFGNDILENELHQLNKYYYTNKVVGIEEEYCIGLAISHLKNKIAISLSSNNCWNDTEIVINEIIDDDLNTTDIPVKNISQTQHLQVENTSNHLMYSGELHLEKCSISPTDKKITLSGDHHGNDKLAAFSKKIFKNEYVVCVINNIDFSPTAKSLIKRIYSDGKIELILHWESAGYGLIIQTTGRNYRETDEIAKMLKKEFDK